MAVKYEEVKNHLEGMPLTDDEKSFIAFVEAYIDGVIKDKFDNNKIRIELTIVNFWQFPPKIGVGIDKQLKLESIKSFRKTLMRKELDNRYKAAGWDVSEEMDDGLDGPNMSGPDYWVLNGK